MLTENTQPAILATSVAAYRLLASKGWQPAFLAGHSLGEYSAHVAAGPFSFADALRIVRRRGRYMQEAVPVGAGAMAAVLGLDADKVAQACEEASQGEVVSPANINGAGQVVIAGEPAAIEAAGKLAKERGARKVMALPVGGAFHTPFMASAAARLRHALAATRFGDAGVPVVANVDAQPHRDGAGCAARLEAQLTAPVRWSETMATMRAAGATTFVELGPGTVLTGMAKRANPDGRNLAAGDPKALDAVVDAAAALTSVDHHDGEHLFTTERMIVSPAAGIFEPVDLVEGDQIERGGVVGHVAGEAIRSPFRGAVVGVLAVAGERLTRSQPVAWLRTA